MELRSRLAKYVVTALSLREVPTYYRTDATVALCWIQREENWGVFVNNRVREIRSLSKKEYWRHIPGKLNPADIASRGCTLQHLLQYGWWKGPEFLKAFPEAWPKSEFSPNQELIAAGMKKKIIVDLSVKIEKPEWFERLSSFSKIVRVFCWMMRFVNKLRKKPSYGTKTLTVEEKAKAEIILWSIEQKKHFHEKENSVHGLQVVRGDDEVLRVKTRIIERDDDLSFLYPILLPSKHYLTECLIREYHLKYCHAGVQILAAKLRLQYWIFSSERNIRSCVSRCVVCKRFTAKALITPPMQLPLDRMFAIVLLSCVALATSSGIQQSQPYKFGYSIKDHHGEQHREESGNGAGSVVGNYGFTDDRRIARQVNYVADHVGFRAQVKTNEPGTANRRRGISND
ncbi:reverse transcriptase [Caerostris darwini]|uniref:Reverse transcriptase n=1 Tax=Caerostris darwini TaxID=1538125 RepID=A0AAV4VMT3_9ARAC|nr:reverse transcriptase [Caerostris darwini]